MENISEEKPLQTVAEMIQDNPDGKVTTTTTTTIKKRDDGTTHTSEHTIIKKQKNEINVEDSKLLGTKQIEAANNEIYVNAVEYKNEVAILKGENNLINMIKLESLKVILRLMGTDLKDFCYDMSFGIYSSEEITEFRKSLSTKIENKVDEYVKDYDYIIAPDEKLLLPNFSGDEIFENVQKEIDIIIEEKRRIEKEKQEKEEEERKREEEERI